ncbi:hypothetical protein Ea92_17 [Erwinia phage Ea9-2]|uniref:Uncharacterized protein n=1 Tax=Erwinia phage Ea9-2 TaxID=1429767 RepID=W6B0Z4_9CAUD|nr:hypothetical protein Ea92_17 [Erwinia phage Ea9-2]AHI60074.1 hypothetical protein Ea92_17 [Erwinia phage Ea9-2]
MSNQTIKRENLQFVGIDEWYRYVFKHQLNGCYFCTVDLLHDNQDRIETLRVAQDILHNADSLYVKSPAKDFEGEPNCPVNLVN